MKIFPSSNLCLFVAGLCAMLSLTVTPLRAVVVLNDFQGTGFQFDYGSWTGNITTNPTHVSITNATEQGGAGTSVLLDLSSYYPSELLRIEARLISGNLADNFNILLLSGSNQHGYQFSTSGLNTSTFTLLTVALNAPTFTSGTMDWSNITQWQIQGDFSSTDTLSLEFRNLDIIPEPTTFALLAGGTVALLAMRRRQKLPKQV